jgi:dihydroxyacetone kinase
MQCSLNVVGMKKLINDPFRVTVESIEGYARAYKQLVKLVSPHVVARS